MTAYKEGGCRWWGPRLVAMACKIVAMCISHYGAMRPLLGGERGTQHRSRPACFRSRVEHNRHRRGVAAREMSWRRGWRVFKASARGVKAGA